MEWKPNYENDHLQTSSLTEIDELLQEEFEDICNNNCPDDFRCPISMELMKDPVTISTGVTYDRHNIETWFFTYKKKTCPATMQPLNSFVITPNHTLKRLILSWIRYKHVATQPSSSSSSLFVSDGELVSLLNTIESSPFKVSHLKKLRTLMGFDGSLRRELVRLGGLEMLLNIVAQVCVCGVVESLELISTFRACEEALAVLYQLSLVSCGGKEEALLIELLSKPKSINSLAIMLQRGSSEARLHSVSIFRKLVESGNYDWSLLNIQEYQEIDLFKSLLELISDDMCTKASTCTLEVLIEIMGSSKKSRVKAIEAGAVCVLIELLPDLNRSKTEKVLYLIKQLCECAEGRLAFVEHGMGIAAVSKKLLHVSNTATKIGVKILWLLSSFHPTERTLEELLINGSVKKLLALMHLDGRSSTKDKVIKIFKDHGSLWCKHPCFPSRLKEYLGFGNHTN